MNETYAVKISLWSFTAYILTCISEVHEDLPGFFTTLEVGGTHAVLDA